MNTLQMMMIFGFNIAGISSITTVDYGREAVLETNPLTNHERLLKESILPKPYKDKTDPKSSELSEHTRNEHKTNKKKVVTFYFSDNFPQVVLDSDILKITKIMDPKLFMKEWEETIDDDIKKRQEIENFNQSQRASKVWEYVVHLGVIQVLILALVILISMCITCCYIKCKEYADNAEQKMSLNHLAPHPELFISNKADKAISTDVFSIIPLEKRSLEEVEIPKFSDLFVVNKMLNSKEYATLSVQDLTILVKDRDNFFYLENNNPEISDPYVAEKTVNSGDFDTILMNERENVSNLEENKNPEISHLYVAQENVNGEVFVNTPMNKRENFLNLEKNKYPEI